MTIAFFVSLFPLSNNKVKPRCAYLRTPNAVPINVSNTNKLTVISSVKERDKLTKLRETMFTNVINVIAANVTLNIISSK
ncbi:hypothetical protein D9M73_250390 [compost metagenome]